MVSRDLTNALVFFPLLGAGGKEDVKNLQIVKTREHIFLISQMLAELECKRYNFQLGHTSSAKGDIL